ncbi:unnamed protein product [Trichogramma brassicae]|uniref:DUF5641 domain-containing protein n=1 Tax=Trichogramma brassicae TaxID=86971 RepID=A0A6H5ISH7_9HYME|nr:unnamed protein product [Trichogramma brassicae]
MPDAFWHRWRKEVLTQMQQRHRWTIPRPCLKPGDMVLMKDDQCPPSTWPLARVESVHPGKDGLVRVATIRTADLRYTRPIAKLIELPRDLEVENYVRKYCSRKPLSQDSVEPANEIFQIAISSSPVSQPNRPKFDRLHAQITTVGANTNTHQRRSKFSGFEWRLTFHRAKYLHVIREFVCASFGRPTSTSVLFLFLIANGHSAFEPDFRKINPRYLPQPSAIVDPLNASPNSGPFQGLRFSCESDSDGERYLRFRAERATNERLPLECIRSVVVVPPNSGLYRCHQEELACQRHPTRPELCVSSARVPRAESPGLRQPIALRPRARSLSPYLRENPPIPPHLYRTVRIRFGSPVAPRSRPRIRTPPRSPDMPAKRHFGLAFLTASEKSPTSSSLQPTALLRLGPPVTLRNPPEVLTPPASPNVSARPSDEITSRPPRQSPPTFKTRAEKIRERNYKRKLAQEKKRKSKEAPL